MFDCVLPTRIARHGNAFTRNGKININTATLDELKTQIRTIEDAKNIIGILFKKATLCLL